MKIIFLDFEGVLVTQASRVIARLESLTDIQAFPPAIEALNKILVQTDAQIVATSSWRSSGMGLVGDLLDKWGAQGRCVDIVPYRRNREEEIQAWISLAADENTYEFELGHLENFAVIDGLDDLGALHPYHFRTDADMGLTEALADRVIAFLNRQRFLPVDMYRRSRSRFMRD